MVRCAPEGAAALVARGVLLRTGARRGTVAGVEDLRREELRRLALWLSRRREVDEAVERLTAYGPAASQQVHCHLDALRVLLSAEHTAFEAMAAAAPPVTQAPLPTSVDPDLTGVATVHSLAAARRRFT